VEHGETGYVVEGEDIQSMGAFMVHLAQSPSMRKNFGKAGRKRVEQEYNYESLSGRLVAIFQTFARHVPGACLLDTLECGVAAKKTGMPPLVLESTAT
jgi:hypothetical protein